MGVRGESPAHHIDPESQVSTCGSGDATGGEREAGGWGGGVGEGLWSRAPPLGGSPY